MQLGESTRDARQKGFGVIWLLASVAITGVGLASLGTLWSIEAQRERERELISIGATYARAIAGYYYASPPNRREYPNALEALIEDRRGGIVRRHLRRLYPDPTMSGLPWGVIRQADGGIVGVYSQSSDRPLLRQSIEEEGFEIPVADRYQDWKFIARTTL